MKGYKEVMKISHNLWNITFEQFRVYTLYCIYAF